MAMNPRSRFLSAVSARFPQRPIFHRELKDPVMANILTETAKKIRYELI